MKEPLIYAIGDIHGHRAILDDLLARVDRDAGGKPYRLVFVGDYIDRGPDSKGVIERLVELQSMDWEHAPVFLMGNHEAKMVDILDLDFTQSIYDNFMKYGGVETFESYGVDAPKGSMAAARALGEAVSGRHQTFLRGLTHSFQSATHFFCHAGVDFSRPLEHQDRGDLLWIREGFLDSSASAAKVVVHGHTITKKYRPEILHNRIGIDTGVYQSGVLTACALDGREEPRFVMTDRWANTLK